MPSFTIDVKKTTTGLSPSLLATGQPFAPELDQSPLIVTTPSVAEPANLGQGPPEAMSLAARQRKSAVPLLIDGLPNSKTPPHRKASGSPAR